MAVDVVLWDADAVLQRDPLPWTEFFAQALGERAGPIGDEIRGSDLPGKVVVVSSVPVPGPASR